MTPGFLGINGYPCSFHSYTSLSHIPGSAEANGTGHKNCLDQVFHFRIGSFSVMKEVLGANVHPYLKLKFWPRFYPTSLG